MTVRSYRARTRPARLLKSFTIEIEQELERGNPSTAFEGACLFLAVRDRSSSFGILVLYLYAKQSLINVILVCFILQYMILLNFENHVFCLVNCQVHPSPNFTNKVD